MACCDWLLRLKGGVASSECGRGRGFGGKGVLSDWSIPFRGRGFGGKGVLSDWSIPFRGRGFGGKGVLSDWSIPFLWIFSSQVGHRVSLACYEKIFISGIRIVAPSKGMMECVSCH